MDIFDVLAMLGGLCLFLFGMNLMGDALERAAGSGLRGLLGKLTGKRFLGFLTGLAVTAVIQSSSATTVMVVGFVNSGLMNLAQAINVIMGANIGTTVTSLLLSMTGIEGDSLVLQLLKPTSFTPILALVGILFQMFAKSSRKKDIGVVLLGFATLMFGMDAMSGAVEGLKDAPWFADLFLMFTNPILGVLAGALLTAVMQSSSASVGILQALSATGAVSYGAALPIIMGQNIGTTITALISSLGTNTNARRAAALHTLFNILGTLILLPVFWVVKDLVLAPDYLESLAINGFGIFLCHAGFNVICTLLLFPCAGLLEKLVCRLVPDNTQPEEVVELDERLLATPAVALEQCRNVAAEMAQVTARTLHGALAALDRFTDEGAAAVRKGEKRTDHYEDILGTYLLKLSALQISDTDSAEAAVLLKAIGDLERIGDHALNILEAAEELQGKGQSFTEAARRELKLMTQAVEEILALAMEAFRTSDLATANRVEPLEEVIDDLHDQLRRSHILRLQQGSCSIEAGFIWNDLLTGLERIGDHCSNLAGCVIDLYHRDMNTHLAIRAARKENPDFDSQYGAYRKKYSL